MLQFTSNTLKLPNSIENQISIFLLCIVTSLLLVAQLMKDLLMALFYRTGIIQSIQYAPKFFRSILLPCFTITIYSILFLCSLKYLGRFTSITKTLTKHDEVWGLSMHVFLVKWTVKYFQISTTTVNILLMLNRELDNERSVLVAKWFKLGWQAIETCIL